MPESSDQDFNGVRKRTTADGRTKEAWEFAELRLDVVLKVMEIAVAQRGRGGGGPEAGDHVRQAPRIWRG